MPTDRKKQKWKPPKCKELDCNCNALGVCALLYDNDFGGKTCPFKKDRKDEYG